MSLSLLVCIFLFLTVSLPTSGDGRKRRRGGDRLQNNRTVQRNITAYGYGLLYDVCIWRKNTSSFILFLCILMTSCLSGSELDDGKIVTIRFLWLVGVSLFYLVMSPTTECGLIHLNSVGGRQLS